MERRSEWQLLVAVHLQADTCGFRSASDCLQGVEGAKRMCYVLQSAASEDTSQEFLMFLAHHATELLKIVTIKVDEVGQPTVSLSRSARKSQIQAEPVRCDVFLAAYL